MSPLTKMAFESIPVWAAPSRALSPSPLIPRRRPVRTVSGRQSARRVLPPASGPGRASERSSRIDRGSLSDSSPPDPSMWRFCFKHLLFWLFGIQARASPHRFGALRLRALLPSACLPKSRAVGGGDSARGSFGWRICKWEPRLRRNRGACDAGPAPALLGAVWVPITLQGSSKKGGSAWRPDGQARPSREESVLRDPHSRQERRGSSALAP